MQLQLLQGDEAEKLYGPLSDTPCTGLQGGCMKECPWKAHQALFQGAGAFNLCLQLIEVGGPLGALREAPTRLQRYGNTSTNVPSYSNRWCLQLHPA